MPKFRSAGSIGWNGVEFFPNADGEVIVPKAAVADLQSHGLVLVEGTDDIIPMPAEAESAYIKLINERDALAARVKDLEEQNAALALDKRTLLARVKELEGLSGPVIEDKANIDPNAPKFGAMSIDDLKAFSGRNNLEVDVDQVPGSIIAKRGAVKQAWDALKKRMGGE